MLILLRALTYATLFVAFFLVVIPQRILRGSGYKWSGSPSWSELTGMGLVIVGLALVMWCLVTFAFVGRGTAAPFDPPRPDHDADGRLHGRHLCRARDDHAD